jgi:hypothetical protein
MLKATPKNAAAHCGKNRAIFFGINNQDSQNKAWRRLPVTK